MTRWIKRRLLIVSLVVLAALAASWWWLSGNGATDGQWQTARAHPADIEDLVTALGTLEPYDYVDVGAQVSGQLEKLHVDLGDKVEKGQLLAEIDASVQESQVQAGLAQLDALRAQLEQQRAELELAQVQFDRQERLRQADATSDDAW